MNGIFVEPAFPAYQRQFVRGLHAVGNDVDTYTEWARAVVHGAVHATLSRQYSAGLIALRSTVDGRIHGYSGVD
ncbi:MAG: hypothetical protein QM650_09640 [Microlunatus sp.]